MSIESFVMEASETTYPREGFLSIVFLFRQLTVGKWENDSRSCKLRNMAESSLILFSLTKHWISNSICRRSAELIGRFSSPRGRCVRGEQVLCIAVTSLLIPNAFVWQRKCFDLIVHVLWGQTLWRTQNIFSFFLFCAKTFFCGDKSVVPFWRLRFFIFYFL